jgi:DNA modification methylase
MNQEPLAVEYRPLESLTPYVRNARTHSDEQVAQIAGSIREFGWTNPVLIDEEGGIIAGHGRVMAAMRLNLTDAPTITLKGLTEAQKRAYVLADNQLALNAGWDLNMLAIELKDLQADIDLQVLGFSAKQIEELIGEDAPVREGRTDEDAVPEARVVTVCRLGDVWTLGRHRLVVGDSAGSEAFQLLMGEEQADLVVTDPPYNVAYEGAAGRIENDDLTDQRFEELLAGSLSLACDHARFGACSYVFHADTAREPFTRQYVASGWKLSQVLIWVKNAATLSRQDYNWRHEPILYGWKEGAAHYFAGDFTKTTVIEQAPGKGGWKARSKAELVEMLELLLPEAMDTTLRHDKPAKSELHPTMKPVQLIRDLIEASSLPTNVVLDPFGGSGTTLIAAEQTNRAARLIEIDPKYADVIIRRWQEFTGKNAVRDDGLHFSLAAAQRIPVHKDAETVHKYAEAE